MSKNNSNVRLTYALSAQPDHKTKALGAPPPPCPRASLLSIVSSLSCRLPTTHLWKDARSSSSLQCPTCGCNVLLTALLEKSVGPHLWTFSTTWNIPSDISPPTILIWNVGLWNNYSFSRPESSLSSSLFMRKAFFRAIEAKNRLKIIYGA